MRKLLLATILDVCAIVMLGIPSMKAQQTFKAQMRETSSAFFQTEEARRIGDQLLLYQRVTGGWPKNIDMSKPLTEKELEQLTADKQKSNEATTDKDAT